MLRHNECPKRYPGYGHIPEHEKYLGIPEIIWGAGRGDEGVWAGEVWEWMKVWLVCFTEIGCAYNMYVIRCQAWFQLPVNSVCHQDKCAKADKDRNSGNILMFWFLKLIFKIRVWKSSINFFRWVWCNSLYLPILEENWSPQTLSDFSKIELVAKSTAGRGQISKHSESFFPSISQYLIYNSYLYNGYLYSVFFIHDYVEKCVVKKAWLQNQTNLRFEFPDKFYYSA